MMTDMLFTRKVYGRTGEVARYNRQTAFCAALLFVLGVVLVSVSLDRQLADSLDVTLCCIGFLCCMPQICRGIFSICRIVTAFIEKSRRK